MSWSVRRYPLMNRAYLAGVLSGFAGGLMGAGLLPYLADSKSHGVMATAGAVPTTGGVATAAAPQPQEVLSARRIQLVDNTGRTRAELAMSPDGGPGVFFYDTAGRNRLVLGLYAVSESEHPFVVLNDTQQHAAGIFRLFGARETPVVVLKNKGRDRSVYGLNPNSLEPFLVNYSSDGRKTSAFGEF